MISQSRPILSPRPPLPCLRLSMKCLFNVPALGLSSVTGSNWNSVSFQDAERQTGVSAKTGEHLTKEEVQEVAAVTGVKTASSAVIMTPLPLMPETAVVIQGTHHQLHAYSQHPHQWWAKLWVRFIGALSVIVHDKYWDVYKLIAKWISVQYNLYLIVRHSIKGC